MAKKKNEASEPAISTIPLPTQDTPLVIDLPDGQKLVVGNIAQGTVIEVATWRGTGRPDSRTNRLMLGVSSTEQATSSTSQSNTPSAAEVTKPKNKLLSVIQNFFASFFIKSKGNPELDELDAFIAEKEREALSNLKAELAPKSDEAPQSEEMDKGKKSRRSSIIQESDDIKSWLDDLMKSTTKEFERQADEVVQTTKGKVKRIKVKQGSKSRAGKKSASKGRRGAKKTPQRSSRAGKRNKSVASGRGNPKKSKR